MAIQVVAWLAIVIKFTSLRIVTETAINTRIAINRLCARVNWVDSLRPSCSFIVMTSKCRCFFCQSWTVTIHYQCRTVPFNYRVCQWQLNSNSRHTTFTLYVINYTISSLPWLHRVHCTHSDPLHRTCMDWCLWVLRRSKLIRVAGMSPPDSY